MIRHFLMAGIVPATFCVANPTAYSESGANVAAMGTYARYGICQEVDGFTLDTAINLNTSFLKVHSVSFSTGIYANFNGWRMGPEFTTGLATYEWTKPEIYTSYAVRGIFDLQGPWSATVNIGFQKCPKMFPEHQYVWPVYSLGLQRKF